MEVLFKNQEEFEDCRDVMKKVFGKDVKFQNNICMSNKKETSSFTLESKSGKTLWFDVVVDNEQNINQESFLEQRVNNLKEEAKLLDVKIANVRNKGDVGAYKNLINAYSEILKLIDRYDWQLMHSEYYTECKKQVAIWQQNGEGVIREHKIWDVK